jgi:hypothetical protein
MYMGLLFAGAKPGIKFALERIRRGEEHALRGAAALRYPATRMGVEDVIRSVHGRQTLPGGMEVVRGEEGESNGPCRRAAI